MECVHDAVIVTMCCYDVFVAAVAATTSSSSATAEYSTESAEGARDLFLFIFKILFNNKSKMAQRPLTSH